MRFTRTTLAVHCIVLVVAVSGCAREAEVSEEHDTAELSANRGEHASDVGESVGEGSGEHGEERSGEHGEERSEEHGIEGSGEHGGERSGEHGGEHSGDEGEESGTQYALNQTYDNVRNGARLILSYEAQTNSFIGTVENTTEKTLERVRVEVHLSNGMELGPTTPVDLKPGEKRAVKLTASSTDFEKWSAHPEIGGGEHGGR
ncbi:FxLYD domain-containing protein [Gemmatimonadota bacterium]